MRHEELTPIQWLNETTSIKFIQTTWKWIKTHELEGVNIQTSQQLGCSPEDPLLHPFESFDQIGVGVR